MTVFYNRHFYVMRQIYRVDAAFGQTGRMDAAWNQENADFRQKSVSYQEEKHMVTAVVALTGR